MWMKLLDIQLFLQLGRDVFSVLGIYGNVGAIVGV
jgi:hypothetical protein